MLDLQGQRADPTVPIEVRKNVRFLVIDKDFLGQTTVGAMAELVKYVSNIPSAGTI
jgi:hypothetical protein